MPDCSVYEDLMNAAALGMAETSLMIAEVQAANMQFASAYQDALIELELCESSDNLQGAVDVNAEALGKVIGSEVEEIRAMRQRLRALMDGLKRVKVAEQPNEKQ